MAWAHPMCDCKTWPSFLALIPLGPALIPLGPTGGTKEKLVGLVYLALADKRTAVVRSHLFSGHREGIRYRASQAALDLLRQHISGKAIE